MRLRKVSSTLRRAVLPTVCGVLLLVVAASCQKPDNSAEQQLSKKLDSSVAQVSGLVTQVETLAGKDQSIEGQVAGLNQTMAGLQGSVDELSKKVSAAGGADAELKKKVDALSGQVSSLNSKITSTAALTQKISLLETRYNDHLRKYHAGG